MKLQQLSVFLENRPAHLKTPCRALADAGINIMTLSLADTQQFGILRLIVREHDRARKALEGAGCVVKTTDVVAVEVPDRPGGLADLLEIVQQCGINIEYMYAFTCRRASSAVMIFRFEDPDGAIVALQAKGVNVVAGIDLFDCAAS